MKMMEEGQKAGKRISARKRNRFLMLVCGLIFISSLVYAALTLSHRNSPAADENPDAHFPSCQLLQADCTDPAKCGLNVYCGEGGHQECRIYDCQNTYGVYAKDFKGEITYKNEPKPDANADQPVREACSGTMAVLSESCVDNKMQVKVKLNTAGQCEIESFALVYGDGTSEPNDFTLEADGSYTITASKCGAISQIIPAAKGGVGLDLNRSGY